MPRDYRLMSADGHLEVPPERWIHRVPEKYRERAPHTVKLPDGGDALMIEGQPLLEANFLDLRAGRAEGTWTPFGLKVADAAGTGGPEQRVREQDQDGMTNSGASGASADSLTSTYIPSRFRSLPTIYV